MSWSSEWRAWHSGAWSLQLRDDEFANIAHEGRVVLRSVRAVVRDRDWATAPLIVDGLRDSGSTLTLHVRSEALDSSFRGVVRVEVRPGRLVVIADLESEYPFDTNRTGLVVLHPPGVASEAMRVTHSDGSIDDTAFPLAISPHQPVFDISELAWIHGGSEVAVRFEGDVFEMEDQRNWSDASFKTYSRPLALPFPYAVAAGERVIQSVSISVREVAGAVTAAPDDVIVLQAGGSFPTIALGASTATDPVPAGLSPLSAELLVELDLGTPTWPAALDRAAASGLRLDVRVVLARAEPRGVALAFARRLGEIGVPIARVAAFDPITHITDAAAFATLRDALGEAGVIAPIVGGTGAHFTELNREQELLAPGLEGVTFAVTPLFHSLGTEQLVESLAMQHLIAEQAVRIANGLPVHVGPVTLRPRFNDVAAAGEPAPTREDLVEGYGAEFTGATDARQGADELAAWTIASVAALAVTGVASIAYFEEWGARGIRDERGEDYPVAAALSALAAMAGGTLLHGVSPDGLVWAVGSTTGASPALWPTTVESTPVASPTGASTDASPDVSTTVLVANLSNASRTVTVEFLDRMLVVEVPAGGFVARAVEG